jgi:GR25 family glycosyltransferase involved in LPS biosynthesis
MTRVSGFYINLDRSPERRAHMEAQIARFGLAGNYQRFAAIEGKLLPPVAGLNGGELGAFMSHLGALKAGRAAGGIVHVLEDDAILSSALPGFAPAMEASGQFDRFDILFTDTFVRSDLAQIVYLKRTFDRFQENGFSLMDLTQQVFSVASSYFVPPRSLDKVIAGLEALRAEDAPLPPLDIAFRTLCGRGELRAGCIAPFITSVRLADIANTTLSGRAGQNANPTVLALALARYSFFIERDLDYAGTFLDALPGPRPGPTGDVHLDLLTRVLAFHVSEHFQPF